MEIIACLGGELLRRELRGLLRQHQGGGINSNLQRRARCIAAAVVDRRADQSEHWDRSEAEDDRDVSMLFAPQPASEAEELLSDVSNAHGIHRNTQKTRSTHTP